MLVLACFVMMVIVAYTAMREGLILAFVNFFSVVMAILVSFNLWPYLATMLEPQMKNGLFDALEDCLPLFGVFILTTLLLRFLSVNLLKNWEFGFSDILNRGGGFVVGLATGYFASGFLVLVLQTIPWHENFLGFQPEKGGLVTRVMPADQAVLKFLVRENAGALTPGLNPQYRELYANFEQLFAQHKRCTESRDATPYVPPEPPADPDVKPEPKVAPKPKDADKPNDEKGAEEAKPKEEERKPQPEKKSDPDTQEDDVKPPPVAKPV